MSNDVSEDMIVEIFSRLQTKSLLLFRSVSKSLYACIRSPRFIRLHTLRSPRNLMIIHKIGFTDNYEYTLHLESQVSSFMTYTGITALRCPFRSFRIVGSCNGILCVQEHRKGCIYFWNPSIRRTVTVHDCPLGSGNRVHGFYFHQVIEDYKILMIGIQTSFVYTMKRHTWSEIASPTNVLDEVKSYQCLFNRALYWLARGYLTDSSGVCLDYILAFDLSSEVFSTIELPEPGCNTSEPAIIKGCLALISDRNIWVRKEHNDTSSWCHVFKLMANPFAGVNAVKRVLYCANNGDILFTDWDNEIIFCRPKKYRWTCGLQQLDWFSHVVDMNECVESLGLLDMGTSCDQESKTLGERE